MNWRPIAQRLADELPGALSDYEIDHLRPLASYDMDDPQQMRAAFAADNHQWMRAGRNRSKGAR